MKLNNKGQAISTILYGMLAITILILLLIFSTMRQSRVLNKKLVANVEKELNTCVNEEVSLEMCYKNDNTKCSTKAYDLCLGKDTSSYQKLANVVSVGDFVDYDAGIWTKTVSKPNESKPYSFGGYTSGSSRNNSVQCFDSKTAWTGWRVLKVANGIVTLIHAGISECYQYSYYGEEGEDNLAYNSEMILRGSTTGNINRNMPYTIHNFNYYINNQYASSVSILDKKMIDDYYGRVIIDSDSVSDNLLDIDVAYFLATAYDDNHLWYAYEDNSTFFVGDSAFIGYNPSDEGTRLTLGIRPVIELKPDVLTSGSASNQYGIRLWQLY